MYRADRCFRLGLVVGFNMYVRLGRRSFVVGDVTSCRLVKYKCYYYRSNSLHPIGRPVRAVKGVV